MSFKSEELLKGIKANIEGAPDAEKKATMKKVNGIFQFNITNANKETRTWTIDLKKTATINEGKPAGKPDIEINCSDDVFADLATGKANGQKLFMQGKIKVKGNMMLATKLDGVLKATPKSKL